MKIFKLIAGIFVAVLVMAVPLNVRADGTNSVSDTLKPKPDLLKTCPVSGEKLGGDMGKPYVFVYKGQEVKLCCPDCKADFDKDPAKYLKKIRAADQLASK
jgi:YHS domain-containing protein